MKEFKKLPMDEVRKLPKKELDAYYKEWKKRKEDSNIEIERKNPVDETEIAYLIARNFNYKTSQVQKGRESDLGGRWLIFAEKESINKWWSKVCDAVEDGSLCAFAKVSTSKPHERKHGDDYVIVVYAEAHEIDIVRERLAKLGVTWRIPLKYNDNNKYRAKGDKNIADQMR